MDKHQRLELIRQSAERLRTGRRFTKPYDEQTIAAYAKLHYNPGRPDAWNFKTCNVLPNNLNLVRR